MKMGESKEIELDGTELTGIVAGLPVLVILGDDDTHYVAPANWFANICLYLYMSSWFYNGDVFIYEDCGYWDGLFQWIFAPKEEG